MAVAVNFNLDTTSLGTYGKPALKHSQTVTNIFTHFQTVSKSFKHFRYIISIFYIGGWFWIIVCTYLHIFVRIIPFLLI